MNNNHQYEHGVQAETQYAASVAPQSSQTATSEGIAPAHGWLTSPIGRTEFAVLNRWLPRGWPTSEMEGMKNFPHFTNQGPNGGLEWFPGEGGPYPDSSHIFPGVVSPLPDGRIFSGGQEGSRDIVNLTDAELFASRNTVWPKTPVQPGQYVQVDWLHTVIHATRGYRYFITRDNWNPNRRATREDFEEVPFASIFNRAGQGLEVMPEQTIKLPENKSGHHIILSVWLVADTGAGFYSAFDVEFSGDGGDAGGSNPPPDVPVWSSSQPYNGGDCVYWIGAIWRARGWTFNNEPRFLRPGEPVTNSVWEFQRYT